MSLILQKSNKTIYSPIDTISSFFPSPKDPVKPLNSCGVKFIQAKLSAPSVLVYSNINEVLSSANPMNML